MHKHLELDDDIIMPRKSHTRRSRKPLSQQNSDSENNKGDFEKLINKIPQTNEEKTIETAQWSWEYKIWIGLICVVVLILIGSLIWFLWKSQETPLKHKVPPGMQGNHFPQTNKESSRPPVVPKTNKDKSKSEKIETHKKIQERLKSRQKKMKNVVIGPVPGIKLDNPEVLTSKKIEKMPSRNIDEIKDKIEQEYDLISSEESLQEDKQEKDLENDVDISVEDI